MTNERHIPIRPRRRRGFTLLELVLAMMVTAIVSVALFSSLAGAFKTRRHAEDHLAGHDAARSTIAMIRADLQAVPPAGGRVSGEFIGLDERDSGVLGTIDKDSLSFITANRAMKSGQDLADLRKIELGLYESSEDPGYYVLARLVTGNLLAEITPEPEAQVLARRVVSLNFQYFDGSEWLDEWDSNDRDNAIPTAVEAVLVIAPRLSRELEDDEKLEHSFITTSLIIRLPAGPDPESTGVLLF